MPFNPDEYLAQKSGFDPDAFLNSGLKIGQEGFGDALRETLKGTDWVTRNAAGAGTALGDIYQGAKQFFGAADPQQLEANRIMAEEAPVGAFAGNAALTAIPFGTIGQGLKGAAIVGAGYGALQPVQGEQSVANILKGKLMNTGLGAAGGAAGQYVGGRIGSALANKAASRNVAQQVNQPIDQTIEAAQGLGLKVNPTAVNPSWWNQLKESIAGKAMTQQSMSNKNASIIDDAMRAEVGMAKNAPLTSDAMQTIRSQAYQQGYAPIERLGTVNTDKAFFDALDSLATNRKMASNSFPNAVSDEITPFVASMKVGKFDAGEGLKMSQILRDEGNDAYRLGNKTMGYAKKSAAKAIEDQIERALQGAGQNGQPLLKGFRDARKLMAKAHTIEDAIVEGGGTINARKLAQRAQAGKPLSGNLKTVGEFANNFPGVTKPAAQVGGPGVSALNAFASLALGGGGGLAGGPVGAALGVAAPYAARKGMQSQIMSEAVQRELLKRYGPSIFERGGNALAQNLPMGLTVGGLEAMGQ